MRVVSGHKQARDAAGNAADVVRFWRAAQADWFSHDPAFDQRFRDRFFDLHLAAARHECDEWAAMSEGSLALLILLDQYPRNAFRGTARMYETDAHARHIARKAINAKLDHFIDSELRLFFYLPFAHSESLDDQQLSVDLNRQLGHPWIDHALGHANIIQRFGRFPHRNRLLGRCTTDAEQAFLDRGGFAG